MKTILLTDKEQTEMKRYSSSNKVWLCQHHYNKWIAKINKLHIGREDMKLQYRVEYEFEIDGKKYSGVETEASWFYIDQRGRFMIPRQ